MMHIVVYGIGAIGGYYGTLLERSIREGFTKLNYRVSFIARGKTLDALKEKGINLKRVKKNPDKSEELIEEINLKNLSLFSSYEDLKLDANEETVVLLCVKSRDTEAAGQEIKKNLTEKTYVISAQNGVENEKKLSSLLGWQKVVGAITNVAVENLEPGKYLDKQMGKHKITVGEFPENQGNLRLIKLEKVFSDAKINYEISEKIEILLWSKLVWNSAFNTLSALYKAELGTLFDDHDQELRGIMNETYSLAKSLGINLAEDLVEQHFNRTNQKEWRDFKTSMLQDALSGKKLEVEDLLGVVIKESEKQGLDCPFSKKTYLALKSIYQ